MAHFHSVRPHGSCGADCWAGSLGWLGNPLVLQGISILSLSLSLSPSPCNPVSLSVDKVPTYLTHLRMDGAHIVMHMYLALSLSPFSVLSLKM